MIIDTVHNPSHLDDSRKYLLLDKHDNLLGSFDIFEDALDAGKEHKLGKKVVRTGDKVLLATFINFFNKKKSKEDVEILRVLRADMWLQKLVS